MAINVEAGVSSGNTWLSYTEIQHLARRLAIQGGLRGEPWVLCCCSATKLDYVICYEAARQIGVPFLPLPPHLRGDRGLEFTSGLPFATSLFLDGDFIQRTKGSSVLSDWVERSSLIFLTSGSTGSRKLVFATEGNVVAALDGIQERLKYHSSDTSICYLPMSFDYGWYQYLLCKAASATLVLVDEGFGLPSARLIDAAGATILPVVPTLLAGIQPLLGSRVTGSLLRKITSTGEVLSQGLIDRTKQRLPAVDIFPMYGLTECKRVSILTPADRPRTPGSVGRALSCCTVYVDQADPSGLGELLVAGGNVTLGTYSLGASKDGAQKSFGGLLRTGDYGRVDSDGFIYVEGRCDSLVKVMGTRISTIEIEGALLNLPEVISARVRVGGDGVEAYCVMGSGSSTTLLRRMLLREFGPLASGIKITAVDQLPHSENYKVSPLDGSP